MRSLLRQHWLFIVLLCIISIAYFAGVAGVPFHPDETTFLFMSTDFERITSNPLDLAWEPADELVPEVRYRMIDAPLTRYLIGLNRSLFSIPIQKQDWNWGSNWHENQVSGAVPDHKTLLASPFAAAGAPLISLPASYCHSMPPVYALNVIKIPSCVPTKTLSPTFIGDPVIVDPTLYDHFCVSGGSTATDV